MDPQPASPVPAAAAPAADPSNHPPPGGLETSPDRAAPCSRLFNVWGNLPAAPLSSVNSQPPVPSSLDPMLVHHFSVPPAGSPHAWPAEAKSQDLVYESSRLQALGLAHSHGMHNPLLSPFLDGSMPSRRPPSVGPQYLNLEPPAPIFFHPHVQPPDSADSLYLSRRDVNGGLVRQNPVGLPPQGGLAAMMEGLHLEDHSFDMKAHGFFDGAGANNGRQLNGAGGVKRMPLICKFFAQGRCARGENCSFAHVTATKGFSNFAGPNSPIVRNPMPMAPPSLPMPPSRIRGRSPLIPPAAAMDMFPQPLGPLPPSLSPGNSSKSCIEELEGQMYNLSKDQYGCRLLQRFLDEQTAVSFHKIFTEIFEHLNELMTDPFGNYLCQKLVSCASRPQRMMIISKVSSDLVSISLNMHGTRVVQKMVEICTAPEEIAAIVEALRSSVVTLIKDLNGNHVIQRCLHNFPSSDNQFIYDAAASHLVSIATHKHGCCVLQRCIDYATDQQRNQLIDVIIENALELVQDAYGNYVVQYVLDLGDLSISRQMMSNMLGHISNLAVQKFSSNVVEKCLQMADDDVRDHIIEEIFAEERLPRLLHDPYANYCIQKALSVSRPEKFNELVARIRPHVAALRATSFGKRIQSKIVKKFPALATSIGGSEPNSGSSLPGSTVENPLSA